MNKIPKIGVGVFVFKNGKFLMGQRRGAHGADTWSVPGGHLEFGETVEDCARREVLEETGLVVGEPKIITVTNDIFLDEDKHYITLWVASCWQSGIEQITEPDKYINMGWYDFDSLPEPLFLPWKGLLVQTESLNLLKDELEASKIYF